MAVNSAASVSPMPTNSTCSVRVYSFTLPMSPAPMVLPISTDAAEAAPTDVTFRSRNSVELMDWAAMALLSMWPSITVCTALEPPHSAEASSMGTHTFT